MLGHELAVQQTVAAGFQPGDEPSERDLRRVGFPAEHAFPEEGAAELHTVQAADQIFAAPHLDRMGVAEAVKGEDGALYVRVDPGFRPVGAGADNLRESLVEGNREGAGAQGALE